MSYWRACASVVLLVVVGCSAEPTRTRWVFVDGPGSLDEAPEPESQHVDSPQVEFPPLARRLCAALIAFDVNAAQVSEWYSSPRFEDDTPISTERLAIDGRPTVRDSLRAADVRWQDTPPSEGWRLRSQVDWELVPWVSAYVFEPRYRLLRIWTVTLSRGVEVVWLDSETNGYGIERVGAPYHRARRWLDGSTQVSVTTRELLSDAPAGL